MTGLDHTCRYTFLNYLGERGMLGEWMSKGELKPEMAEWAEYVRWCVKAVREEGWIDFCEQNVEGWNEKGSEKGVDCLMGDCEISRANRILGGE